MANNRKFSKFLSNFKDVVEITNNLVLSEVPYCTIYSKKDPETIELEVRDYFCNILEKSIDDFSANKIVDCGYTENNIDIFVKDNINLFIKDLSNKVKPGREFNNGVLRGHCDGFYNGNIMIFLKTEDCHVSHYIESALTYLTNDLRKKSNIVIIFNPVCGYSHTFDLYKYSDYIYNSLCSMSWLLKCEDNALYLNTPTSDSEKKILVIINFNDSSNIIYEYFPKDIDYIIFF